jgi:hypothetical protein
MNLRAIEIIQRHGGVIVLMPLRVGDSVTITDAFKEKDKIIDIELQEKTGLPCMVIIGKRESALARKELESE